MCLLWGRHPIGFSWNILRKKITLKRTSMLFSTSTFREISSSPECYFDQFYQSIKKICIYQSKLHCYRPLFNSFPGQFRTCYTFTSRVLVLHTHAHMAIASIVATISNARFFRHQTFYRSSWHPDAPNDPFLRTTSLYRARSFEFYPFEHSNTAHDRQHPIIRLPRA